MTKNTVAIIPARGGSKRIPRKNIKNFLGKPIIVYSIQAALASNCFNEVMVSTDDPEIAKVAKEYGASVPFFRSIENANDHAMITDAIIEVLLKYQEIGQYFDYACCILPTAPFISPNKIKEAYDILKTSKADEVVPVVRFGYPIQRALKIENGKLSMIYPENLRVNSQDLMPTYHDCGQFYWLNIKSFLEQKKILMEQCFPIIVPENEVHDIDSIKDWEIAEIKYRNNKQFIK